MEEGRGKEIGGDVGREEEERGERRWVEIRGEKRGCGKRDRRRERRMMLIVGSC